MVNENRSQGQVGETDRGKTPTPLLPDTPRPLLPLSAFLPRSRANGPGIRSVLWVQGCPFRCPGCFNPDFLDFTGGRPTPVETVVDWILRRDDTEGVTFSGGEPFAHAAVLAAVAEPIRRARKSVVIFTGYTKEDLWQSDDADQRRLWELADLLIAGPYRRDQPSRHPWLSSANQELVFLTDRYRPEDLQTARKRVEYRIEPGGRVTVTGFPGSLGEEGNGSVGEQAAAGYPDTPTHLLRNGLAEEEHIDANQEKRS